MWIKQPGKINERLDFLGTSDICLYLLRGEEAAIFGGGMSFMVPSLEAQLSRMDLDLGKIKYLIISHSHLDHVGAVPYLKRKLPHIQTLASAHAAEVFSKEKAVNFIAAANKQMIDKLGLQNEYDRLNLKFDGIKVDRIVGDNDVLDLGRDIEIHFMEVTGHTRCSIATYVPKLKALFPADALPPPSDNAGAVFVPGPQYDFGMYKKSMEKLASCDVETLAFEHFGVVTGDQVKLVLRDGPKQIEKFEKRIVELYRQTQDFDATVRRADVEILQKNELSFMDREIQVTVLATVIRKILMYAGLLSERAA